MATNTLTLPTLASISLSSTDATKDDTISPESFKSPIDSEPQSMNPQTWPTDFRLVPAFRAIDRNLESAERPYGANLLEYTFISVMLQGVRLQSVSAVQQMSKAFPLTLSIISPYSGKLPELDGGQD